MNAKNVPNLRASRKRVPDRAAPPRPRAQVDRVRGRLPAAGAAVSLAEIFTARAEARALLWQAAEFELHEAVDELQAAAEASGLIAELGQDAVQAIIAKAFEALR
jgi:hypothetical protein